MASARLHKAAQAHDARRAGGAGQPGARAVAGGDPAQVRMTAETPVTKVAQLTGPGRHARVGRLRDDVDRRRPEAPRDGAQQGRARRDRAVPRGRAVRGRDLHAGVRRVAANSSAHTPITDMDDTVGLLNAYTGLIAYAADTNRTYADSLGLRASEAGYLGQLIEESDALTRRGLAGVPRTPRADGPGPPAVVGGAAGVRRDHPAGQRPDVPRQRGGDGPPNLAPIKDPATVRTQAQNADEIAQQRGQRHRCRRPGSLLRAMEQPMGRRARVRPAPEHQRRADAARAGVPMVRGSAGPLAHSAERADGRPRMRRRLASPPPGRRPRWSPRERWSLGLRPAARAPKTRVGRPSPSRSTPAPWRRDVRRL